MIPAEDLPKRTSRAALAELIKSQRPPITSEEELELLLSGFRAVGRARVVYTQHPTDDVLEAVLTGLRRL
ncbi:hypothetical protein [Salinispora cortesiana]|uniref:hypothetical protein n=1 Tax=Salinispora cortesiana TaxID=1305843 RepID=UPI000424F67A|nr:hypothetical protein [Salinispora cortesiana]